MARRITDRAESLVHQNFRRRKQSLYDREQFGPEHMWKGYSRGDVTGAVVAVIVGVPVLVCVGITMKEQCNDETRETISKPHQRLSQSFKLHNPLIGAMF